VLNGVRSGESGAGSDAATFVPTDYTLLSPRARAPGGRPRLPTAWLHARRGRGPRHAVRRLRLRRCLQR
jgi:hypothetical protein